MAVMAAKTSRLSRQQDTTARLVGSLCFIALALPLAACSAPPSSAATAQTSCPVGEVLDGDTCLPEACGTGLWGNLSVDDETVYVDVAAADGDGSVAAPFASIQEGVNLAGERGGGLVAVAAGTYMETIAMGDDHRDVTLAGRCKELVAIDGSEGKKVPTIKILGDARTPEVAIVNMTVTGGRYTGVWAEHAAASVAATDIRENSVIGLVAVDAEVDLADSNVSTTAVDQQGDFGIGVEVVGDSRLTTTGVTIDRNASVGLLASGAGVAVDLVDTMIVDTALGPDDPDGHGVEVADGASITVTTSVVQGNSGPGLWASGERTSVRLRETEISDTVPGRDGSPGTGILVHGGAYLHASACVLQGNADHGVMASGEATNVELSGTAIRDTVAAADGSRGRGVSVDGGAALRMTDCAVARNIEVGVFVADAGTTAELVDTEVTDTLANGGGGYFRGMAVQSGAHCSLTRCTIRGNTGIGLNAANPGTSVILTDTRVAGTGATADGGEGWGIDVEDGASMIASGCVVEGNADLGIGAFDLGTIVDLENTVVRATLPGDGVFGGTGIHVQEGASLAARGCSVEGNAFAGIHAGNEGTWVELWDTRILDTVAGADGAAGDGVVVANGASLTASRCVVQGNTRVGVLAAHLGTSVDLIDTQILDTSSSDGASGGRGLNAVDGAVLTATGCSVERNTEAGVFALGFGTIVHLVDSTVIDTLALPDGTFGRGISVQGGASLTALACSVRGNVEAGVSAFGEGTTVQLLGSEILDTRRGPGTAMATGASAQTGAALVMSDCELSTTEGPGFFVHAGGRVEADGIRVSGNRFAGVLITDGSALIVNATITGTLPDAQWGGGCGVYATDLGGAPSVVVTDSEIGHHPYAAVWLDGPGSYQILDSKIAGGASVADRDWAHGNAIFAENGIVPWNGQTGLLLNGNTIHDALEVGVFLDDSSASFVDNLWDTNRLDLVQQGCNRVSALDRAAVVGASSFRVCDAALLYDTSLHFDGLYLAEAGIEE